MKLVRQAMLLLETKILWLTCKVMDTSRDFWDKRTMTMKDIIKKRRDENY